MGCGNSRSTKIKEKEQSPTVDKKNSAIGKGLDSRKISTTQSKTHKKKETSDNSKIDGDKMFNLANAEDAKNQVAEKEDPKPNNFQTKSPKVERRVEESAVSNASPLNSKKQATDPQNEKSPIISEKGSIREIVKPVMKKEIPSVTPAMGPSKIVDDQIKAFDENIFPPNMKKKLPPLDPRKLPPLENKPSPIAESSGQGGKIIGKPKLGILEKEAPKVKKVEKKEDPILPFEPIQKEKEVINTDSSLKLSEGAMAEAQDYVSDIFSKSKQTIKSKNPLFNYQKTDGGDLKSVDTKDVSNVKSTSGNNGSSFMTDKIKGFQIATETEENDNNIMHRSSLENNEVSKRMANTRENFHRAEKEETKALDYYNQAEQSQGGIMSDNNTSNLVQDESVEKDHNYRPDSRISTVTISEGKMNVAQDYVGVLWQNAKIMTKPAGQKYNLSQASSTPQRVDKTQEDTEKRTEMEKAKAAKGTRESVDSINNIGDFKEKRESDAEARRGMAQDYVSGLLKF